MRAVLEPNVLVSALISSAGPSREILEAWALGRFELVASPALLGELGDVLARPRFRRWVAIDVARDFIAGLTDAALVVEDAPAQVGLTADSADYYLVALARAAAAADCLVSGDRHLTGLVDPGPADAHARSPCAIGAVASAHAARTRSPRISPPSAAFLTVSSVMSAPHSSGIAACDCPAALGSMSMVSA